MKNLNAFQNQAIQETEQNELKGGRIVVFDTGDSVWIWSNGEDITTYVDGMNWGSDVP
ncbi:MAG TPA: hypothetical protein PKA00_21335 [Saprospiraceae bacterium]|nr:hypothetical protein [Saprospiraceae bacterium]HMQ85468.1 hypothetical protein [Saprospiraceae bacterium]